MKSASRNMMTMSAETQPKFALLFDCDGVIVETEELHRIAYNGAFEAFGLEVAGNPVVWTEEYYDKLQNTVGGGKPKMKYYFTNDAGGWPLSTKVDRPVPLTEEDQTSLIDDLQDKKTEIYKEVVSQVAKARPGVLELMDQAIADPEIAVGICSAATKAGFVKVVDAVVGQERLSKLDVVMAGDDVKLKKPDPMIYNLAREKLGLPAADCVVVEDSLVGLRAAKAAGMNCIITYTSSTESEDFYSEGAQAKMLNLDGITLNNIFDSLKEGKPEDILAEMRDPILQESS